MKESETQFTCLLQEPYRDMCNIFANSACYIDKTDSYGIAENLQKMGCHNIKRNNARKKNEEASERGRRFVNERRVNNDQ